MRLPALLLLAPSFLFCVEASAEDWNDYDESDVTFVEEEAAADDPVGFYARIGLPIHFPNADVAFVNIGAGAGIGLTAGLRVAPAFAAELDVMVTGGHEVEIDRGYYFRDAGDLTYVAALLNAKAFPFRFLAFEVPSWIDPYLVVGIGGGGFTGDVGDEGAFIARFAGGAEFPVFERAGFYVEAGVDVTTVDVIPSLGRIALGVTYRF